MFFNFMKNTPLKRDRESAAVSTPDEEKITSAAPTLDGLNDNLTITNDKLVTDSTNNNTINNQMCDKTGQTIATEANNVKTDLIPESAPYEHQQQEEEPKQQSASSEEILLAEEDEDVFNHKMQTSYDSNNNYNKKQEINTTSVVAPAVTSVRNVPNSAYIQFHGDYSNGSDTPIETHSTECSSHSYSSSSSSSSSYSSASSSSSSSASKSFTSHKTTPSSENSASHSQNSFYYSDAESNEVCISQMKRKIVQRNRNKQNNNNNNFIINNSVMNDDCCYEPHNENIYYKNQNQQLFNSSNDKNQIDNTNQYKPNNNDNEVKGFNNDEYYDENEDEDDNDDHNSHNRRQDRKKRYPRFTSEYAERFRHEMVPFLRILPYFTPCDEILESNCPYNNNNNNNNNNRNGNNATSKSYTTSQLSKSTSMQEKQQLQRVPEHKDTQSHKKGDETFTQQHFQSLQSEHELFTPISQPSENTIGLTAPSLIITQNANYNKQQYEDDKQERQYCQGNKRPRSDSPRRHPLVLYGTYLYCRTLGKGTYSKVVLAQRVPPSALAMRDALHYNKLYHGSNNNNNVSTTPNSPYQRQYSEINNNKNNNGIESNFQNNNLCNNDNNNAVVMNTERTSTSYAASANTFTFSNNKNNSNSETYNRISTRSVELNTPGMAALRALHSNVNGIGLGGGDSVGGGVPLVALKVFRDKDAYREACWDEVAVLRALCRPDNHISHQHHDRNNNYNDNDGGGDTLGQYAVTAHCPIAGDDGGAALMGYLSHVGRFVGFIEYIPHPVHPAIAFPVMGPSLLHVVRNVKRASKREQARCRQFGQEYQLRKQTEHDIHNYYHDHHKEELNNQKKKQEYEITEYCGNTTNSCGCNKNNNTHNNKANNYTSEETEHKELLYRGLSTSLLKTVLYQILLFLQYIHARGVVHTDLKPENVLFESRIALPKELPIYSSRQHDNHHGNRKNKYSTTNASSQNHTYSDKHNDNTDYNSNNVTCCVPRETEDEKHNSEKEKMHAEQEKQAQLMLSEQKERNNEMKMHSAQAAMKSKPYYENETDNNNNKMNSNMNELDNMNKNSPIGQRANKTNNDNHETQCIPIVDAEHDEREKHQCHHDPVQDVNNAESKRNEQHYNNNNEEEEEEEQQNKQKQPFYQHQQQFSDTLHKTQENHCCCHHHHENCGLNNNNNNVDESSFHTECTRTISHVVRVRLPLLNSVRVTDLGTAQFLANFTHRSHIDGVTLVSYDVIQTSHYRAPEVIMGVGWSQSADLFSLGCMIPELLTGECLFMPKDTLEHLALMEHIIGPFQPAQRLNAKYFQQSHYVHDHPEQCNNWSNNENENKNYNNTSECNAQSSITQHTSLDEFTNKERKTNNNDDLTTNNGDDDDSNMEEDKYGNDNILREVFAINGATYSHYFNLRTNKLRWPLSERMLSEFHEEKRQEREMRRRARRRERVKQMQANQQEQQRQKQQQHYKYNYNEEEEDDNYYDDEEDDELLQPLSVTRSKDYKFVKEKPTLRQILGFDKELLDFTRRLLCYNPLKRITADEALRHPYFSAM